MVNDKMSGMIQAAIFDLDGTVLDNESMWENAFRSVVGQFTSLPVSQLAGSNEWVHEAGIGIAPNWRKIVGSGGGIEKLTRETVEEYRREIEENGDPQLREGLVELVEAIKEMGWWTALATGSDWNVVEPELEQLKLYLAFDVTTTGEEVLMQKPDPEIYLLTAQKLGLNPEECLVIEDSVAGIRAGVEAGMTTIGLESDYASREELEEAGAKLVVGSLQELVISLRKYGSNEKT